MVGTCGEGTVGFSAIASAGAYSALAGVVAGVLFTGVVLLVSISPPANAVREKDRKSALLVMVPTFFGLLICSFLFGAVAGEQVCPRAEVEVYAAGSLLAVAGVGTLQAITWMLSSLEGVNRPLMDIVAGTRVLVALFGLAQLGVTTNDFLDLYGTDGAALRDVVVVVFAIGVTALIALVAAYARRTPAGSISPAFGAWATLLFVLPAVAFFDLAANTTQSTWLASATPLIATVAIPVLAVLYVVGVVLQLLGNPRRPT